VTTWEDDELTVEDLARLRRRSIVRRVIVILVVIAMVATLVVPLVVRVVRTPAEPEGIVAIRPTIARDRMTV
jgi:hypothetical protein